MIRTVTAAQALALLLSVPLAAQNARTSAPPDWTRGGVCYEIFVRSFFDSDGDGVGDLRGITQKLDYINDGNATTDRDLGANCIWLTPVAQSPSYHGYDISNYYQINRDFGTNDDFRQLVAEAHKRGIRVLFDLVLNHTASDHPYFRSAILNAASPYHDWYEWSPVQRKLSTWQAPVWHPAGTRNEFYFGLFWSGMPDLNLRNPAVTAEAEKIARFWLEQMGVDGFRFDAVQNFFESGDSVRNVPPIHEWLRDYSAALQRIKPDVYTVGEVWETVDVQSTYYPDQLTSYFTFEVADALINAIRTGSATQLLPLLTKVQSTFPPLRWSPFLRNHDQTRTMSEFNGDVARNKLATTLLLTLPGLPFLYYGEEIGMTGLKAYGDLRIRTPMQWTRTKAVGFTTGLPWEPLQPDSFTANVEAQENDATSLLNVTRRMIHLRTRLPALGAGDFVALQSPAGTIAYARRSDSQSVVVVANLTDHAIAKPLIASSARVLKSGRYGARDALGAAATSLRVRGNGVIRGWTPLPSLAPYQTAILVLERQ
ncbi:MAG TPA: alpha-amylase family glycosyl hydrolase [Longimicrobiales bacterium]